VCRSAPLSEMRSSSQSVKRLVALCVVVAGALGAFAIYTFGGYRDSHSSRVGRGEQARVASILRAKLGSDSSYYIIQIRRSSPGNYLVRWGNLDHPSIRVCVLTHIDLAKWKQGSATQMPCD
jgi:hypothetical protein